MRADAEVCRGDVLRARDLLSPAMLAALQTRFSARQVEYVSRVLTTQELAVIGDLADALVIARIKRMPERRLRQFDQMIPHDGDHQLYRTLQMQWLRDEEYLLGTQLGRRPTHKELFLDFMNHHNGLRFRAYFSLKYPDRVRAVRRKAAAAVG
jgi:hypothetical protein